MSDSVDMSEDLYSSIRLDVNKFLYSFCKQQAERAVAQGPQYIAFWLSINRLIRAGGKRMRPFLTIQAYDMYGGLNRDGIMAVAASQEILHISMLVHDDIIDRDEVRYGIPNIIGHYRQVYATVLKAGELTHYSNSAALLAGDALLSAAYSLIMESTLNADQKVLMAQGIARSIYDVVGGELMEIEALLHDITESDPLKIAQYKTASYSFIGPLVSGAMLAGAPEQDIEQLKIYGLNLGIAFQLADDLLGMFGDESVTGKPNNSDIIEGKPTYLMQQAYKYATESQSRALRSIVGIQGISEEDIEHVRQIAKQTKADESVKMLIKKLVSKATDALDGLNCSEAAKLPLRTLLNQATERPK